MIPARTHRGRIGCHRRRLPPSARRPDSSNLPAAVGSRRGSVSEAADWILSRSYNDLVTFGIRSLTAIFHNFLWVLLASIPLGIYVWPLLSPLGP